jgi:hypothetical protein
MRANYFPPAGAPAINLTAASPSWPSKTLFPYRTPTSIFPTTQHVSTDASKWVVLAEMNQARSQKDEDVLNSMRHMAELTSQQPAGAAAFVAAT